MAMPRRQIAAAWHVCCKRLGRFVPAVLGIVLLLAPIAALADYVVERGDVRAQCEQAFHQVASDEAPTACNHNISAGPCHKPVYEDFSIVASASSRRYSASVRSTDGVPCCSRFSFEKIPRRKKSSANVRRLKPMQFRH